MVQARNAVSAQPSRAMSSGNSIEHEIKEMNMWRNITLYVGLPGSVGLGVYTLTHEEHHEHEHVRPCS